LAEGIVTVAVMTAMERSLQTKQPVAVRAILDEHDLGQLAEVETGNGQKSR
jgi:hypothetical protein